MQEETRTTTTVVVTGPHFLFNPSYVSRIPGILTIIEIVLSLIVIICVGSTVQFTGTGFVMFTAVVAFIYCIARLVLYLLSVPSSLENVPWMVIGLFSFGIWTFFWFISGAIAAARADSNTCRIYNPGDCRGAYGAGSFFCFVAVVVFGIHTFFFFASWRSGFKTEEAAVTSIRATTSPPPSSAVSA